MTYRQQRRAPEHRKALRRKLNYPAHIEIFEAAPMERCMIVDISKTGAKLGTPNALDLPDEFTLVLGGVAVGRRPCKVVWRQDKFVGILFTSVKDDQRLR